MITVQVNAKNTFDVDLNGRPVCGHFTINQHTLSVCVKSKQPISEHDCQEIFHYLNTFYCLESGRRNALSEYLPSKGRLKSYNTENSDGWINTSFRF